MIKVIFKLDDTTGTLRDLSAWVLSVPCLRPTVDILRADSIGGSSTVHGLRDGQEFTVDFTYHPTPWAQIVAVDALREPSLAYEIGREGSVLGKSKVTGKCNLVSLNLDSDTFSATFIQTGEQVWDTY
jgi:hypothetical protein